MQTNRHLVMTLMVLNIIKTKWRTIVLVTVPLFLSPLVITGIPSLQCGFVILVVSIYWVSEVMNIAITALIPAVLFPIFGILEPSKVASCYMKDITLMLIGGLIIAKTVEKQKLHSRFALRVLTLMGPNPIFQYLGFMLSTWFFSMWVSNATITAMMITLANAVVEEWKIIAQCTLEPEFAKEVNMSEHISDGTPSTVNSSMEKSGLNKIQYKQVESISKGLLISIAYSATCGGMATIPGTPPNMVLYGFIGDYYGPRLNLNFGTFMLFSLPMSTINILSCWLLLLFQYVGYKNIFNRQPEPERDKKIMEILETQYKDLGPISYGEISTLVVVGFLVFLRIMRETAMQALQKLTSRTTYWTDGISAILAAWLVFNLPNKNPFKASKHRSEKLMNWPYIEKKLAWNIVFLFGGGFTLAAGCDKSGLSANIGSLLTHLKDFPHYVIILCVSLGISFFTEITSNVVTATILLPVMLKMAECIGMHPMRIGLTVTIACSFSFCLPAGTPANAIVFSTGKIRVIEMVSSGIILNMICVLNLSLMAYFYSVPIFHTNVFPDWIESNCTRF